MRRFLPVFVLSISLTAVGQVTITPSGQATSSGPAITPAQAQPPAIVPANVALPGSGPATGLPPDITVNDSRTGGAVSVYQPREVVSTTSNAATAATNAPAAASTAPANEANNMDNSGSVVSATNANLATTNSAQPVKLGIQNYVGAQTTTASAAPPVSLGDVARINKSHQQRAVRTFTNESIGAKPANTNNGNEQPKPKKIANDVVLDRNDLAQVEASLHRHDADQNTEMASARPADPAAEYARLTSEAEKHQSDANTSAQSAPANPQADQSAANQETKRTNGRGGVNDQLPSSSSPLPLLALLGFAAFTGGIAYRYGQR